MSCQILGCYLTRDHTHGTTTGNPMTTPPELTCSTCRGPRDFHKVDCAAIRPSVPELTLEEINSYERTTKAAHATQVELPTNVVLGALTMARERVLERKSAPVRTTRRKSARSAAQGEPGDGASTLNAQAPSSREGRTMGDGLKRARAAARATRKKFRADRDVRHPTNPTLDTCIAEVREALANLESPPVNEGYDKMEWAEACRDWLVDDVDAFLVIAIVNNLPALLAALEALRDELNTEHPYRELWEAAEEELGRLRKVASSLGTSAARDLADVKAN